MCTEIDKHCEIGHKRLLMSSIETENQLSNCRSTIGSTSLRITGMVFLKEEGFGRAGVLEGPAELARGGP